MNSTIGPDSRAAARFVRLALEEAGAAYVDVARGANGMPKLMKVLEGKGSATPPFAPPILVAGKLAISQTANILMYLGAHEGLAPANLEAGRLWAHQLQLTVTDFPQGSS